jgi:hypothetical protein
MGWHIDLNSLLSAIIGGLITFSATVWNFRKERQKELQRNKDEEEILSNKFFLELNYNKRKIIYMIENTGYKLTRLDNSNWRDFIYSKASYALLKDKEVIEELVVIDSITDQVNDRIRAIDQAETVMFQSKNPETKLTIVILTSSLREYVKNELQPRIVKIIPRLEELFYATRQGNVLIK